MTEKYLLGANKYNELVFGEFGITRRNGYPEFTASFFTVRPFNGDNIDLVEYYNDWMEDMPKDYLYDLCEEHDCSPSCLAESLADICDDIRDVIDCSLYSESYLVDGEEWYFESGSCGQHDTRDEMEEIINIEAYNLIHELWDKHHLKPVNDDVIAQVEALQETLDSTYIDFEEEWIVGYIKRHKDELD